MINSRDIPDRTVEVTPTIVKILGNRTPVISYYWEGAEFGMINSNDGSYRWPDMIGGTLDGGRKTGV